MSRHAGSLRRRSPEWLEHPPLDYSQLRGITIGEPTLTVTDTTPRAEWLTEFADYLSTVKD